MITPYGSQTVTWGNAGGSSVPAYGGYHPTTGYTGYDVGGEAGAYGGYNAQQQSAINSYQGNNRNLQPTVTQTFSPEQQALYDKNNNLSTSLLDTAQSSLDEVNGMMATPFDMSRLTSIDDVTANGNRINYNANIDLGALNERQTNPSIGGVDSVYNALVERQNPEFTQQRQSLESDLKNRGFVPGSEAYNFEMDRVNRQQNDFSLGARLAAGQEQSRLVQLESQLRAQGLGEQQVQAQLEMAKAQFSQSEEARLMQEQLSTQNAQAQQRQQEIQEQAYLRSLPLNEINALRTGSQANLPQFQAYQGQSIQAAPLFQATQAQGQHDLANFQSSSNPLGGLFDLVGAGVGAAGAAGGFGNLFNFSRPASAG